MAPQETLLTIILILTASAKKTKPTFDRYLCETNILDGNDPGTSFFSLQFRWGHQFTDGECRLPSQKSNQQQIDLYTDITPCLASIRRIAPQCDSYWTFESGEIWSTDIAEDNGPFALPYYPGGVGAGSAFPGWADVCIEAYPDGPNSVNNIDYAVEYLCGNDNDFAPLTVSRCSIQNTQYPQGGFGANNDIYEYEYQSTDCDNMLFLGSTECVQFIKFFGVRGYDCEMQYISDVNDGFFGAKWRAPEVPQLAANNLLPGIETAIISYLCAPDGFKKAGYSHSVCKVPDNYNALSSAISGFSDNFVKKSYVFTKHDCYGDKLPKHDDNDECVVILKSHIICCEYSINFKAIGVSETIDGIKGPGVTFEVWKNGTMDETLCVDRISDDIGIQIEVEYLCPIQKKKNKRRGGK